VTSDRRAHLIPGGNLRAGHNAAREKRQGTSLVGTKLFPLPLPLNNRYVAIDWQISKTARLTTRLRPLYFHPVESRTRANSKDHARIVRRKITASTNFELGAFQLASLVSNLRTDRINIGLRSTNRTPSQ